jgi:hypothetical protein
MIRSDSESSMYHVQPSMHTRSGHRLRLSPGSPAATVNIVACTLGTRDTLLDLLGMHAVACVRCCKLTLQSDEIVKQIADAAVVYYPEHQPEAEVVAQQHPPRRRPPRARAARAAQGLDRDDPRPVGLPRGGGVHGHPVRAVPRLRPRLPRQPGVLAHSAGHGGRTVELEAMGATRGVARARARRRSRVPARAHLRLGPHRVHRSHRRVVHQHQARRAVRHRPGHVQRGRRRRGLAVRRRLRHGVHGGGRGPDQPTHGAGRRAACHVHGRRCRVRRALRGRRPLHGRVQALLA